MKKVKNTKNNNIYYVLEVSCDPGGTRKGDFYKYKDLNSIKKALYCDLCDHDSCRMILWYGEDIVLYKMSNSKIIASIDIHQYLKISIDWLTPITFDKNKKNVYQDNNSKKYEKKILGYELERCL